MEKELLMLTSIYKRASWYRAVFVEFMEKELLMLTSIYKRVSSSFIGTDVL